jgi:hypothetical protein
MQKWTKQQERKQRKFLEIQWCRCRNKHREIRIEWWTAEDDEGGVGSTLNLNYVREERAAETAARIWWKNENDQVQK